MKLCSLCLLFVLCCAPVATAADDAHSGAALRATHVRKSAELAQSPLKRPLLLTSTELPQGLQGEIYAVVEQPLEAVHAAFNSATNWCDVLLLHVNNRRCQASSASGKQQITLGIVRRYDKPVEEAFDLPFVFRVAQATPDYLEVQLRAESGPLGTSNYRILLEATKLDAKRSFLHFSYSYDQNVMVAMAIQAYLATFGSSKVGFTELGKLADGQPAYIAGTRGLVERNAMRYFLTLEAFLSATSDEARREAWFSAIQRYPRQLHEIDRETYLALKRTDAQQRPAPP
ncbi:hypothetical protein ACSFA8_02905 [Variovorax sp. RT4R15]|uniref:hypothetical protein n=1 Tax=Variovorax sp. RT4R15 TaxID=3443737 RepID=UPI003F45D6D1